MDLMIDIEALGTSPDSIILTIGAQVFDTGQFGWYEDKVLNPVSQQHYTPFMNVRVDVDEQYLLNRKTDDDTMAWWGKQSPEAITEAFSEENRISLNEALDQLIELAWPCKHIWSKGPTYDITILENAMKASKRKLPWKFWSIRDCRTVYSLCPDLNTNLNGHIALDDCRNQIVLLQESFRLLGVGAIK